MNKCRLYFPEEGESSMFELGDGPIRVGRSSECDLVITDTSVSRFHAEFIFESGKWYVRDLGSKHGVVVNDLTILGRKVILNGDIVQLGSVDLIFQTELSGPGFQFTDDDLVQREMKGEISLDSIAGKTLSVSEMTEIQDGGIAGQDLILPLFEEAARSLLSSSDLDQMLETVLDLAFAHLPAERACIGLCPHGDDRVVIRLTKASDPAHQDQLKISTTITSEAIRGRTCVSYLNTEATKPLSESITRMRLTSIMCAPLCVDDEVLGVIYLDTCDLVQLFGQEHLRILSALASLSAVALREAKLRENMLRAERIHERLSRYSSPKVVERLVEDEGEGGTVSGMIADEAVITVLFADLSGFTSLAEKMSPTKVTEVLNEIFAGLTEAVFEEEGTVDKFIGDEVMAFFGAPIAQPDHALRAVRCALSMQERLGEFNALHSELPDLTLSIGINSGPVIVGDIGSPQRRDYTVIGDTVNTAKRIEDHAAKGGLIIIGPKTNELLAGAHPTSLLDSVQLRGKAEELSLHVVERGGLPGESSG